jgi:hypothetical protein
MTIYQKNETGRSAGLALGVVCQNQNMPFIPGEEK